MRTYNAAAPTTKAGPKNKTLLVPWLPGDHLLLRDFGSYVIVIMNASIVITVDTVMLLRDTGLIFITVFNTLNFPVTIYGKFTSFTHYSEFRTPD
jgi:hypothetical protein